MEKFNINDTEKKMVRVSGSSIYFAHLAGSIDDAIKRFQELKTKGYVYFEECENYDGCIIGLTPYFQREETDAEYQARIKGRRYVQPKKEKGGFKSIGFCEENLGITLKIKDTLYNLADHYLLITIHFAMQWLILR